MNNEAVSMNSQREADRAAGRAEMAALILDMVAGSRIATAAPTNLPTAAELNTLWLDYDDPVDFAGAVLERWGGWLPGILGYGGALAARLLPRHPAGNSEASEDLAAEWMRGGPSLRPGSWFLIDLCSALRHADAFEDGKISIRAIEELVARHQPSFSSAHERDRALDEAKAACSGLVLAMHPEAPSGDPTLHNLAINSCVAAIEMLRHRGPPATLAGRAMDDTECLDFLTRELTDAICLGDGRVIEVGGCDVRGAIHTFLRRGGLRGARESATSADSSLSGRALYLAALGCAHTITDERIVLHRNQHKPGNALAQLADRLDDVHKTLRDGVELPVGAYSPGEGAHAYRLDFRLVFARRAGKKAAFHDLTEMMESKRALIAVLLAHGWRVTALELQSKDAIEARQEGLTFACGERFEADGQVGIGPRMAGATHSLHEPGVV